MKWSALVMAVLLVGSLIPLSMAAENTTAVTTAPTLQLDNSTREEVIAGQLINQLQRLSKFAENRIGPIKDKLPENSSILEDYQKAEEYKAKAVNEYGSGDYYNSILDSLTAMHFYKAALIQLKEGRKKAENIREHMRAETARMMEYFKMVGKTIRIAQKQGIDVSNLTVLYNETRSAYRLVLDDLKAKNFEKAKEDLAAAREKKAELDSELKKVRRELAYKNADKIVREFLVRGEKGMELAQKAIKNANERGYNTTELQRRLNAFKSVYEEVKNLADEGKWGDALKVMNENRKTIMDFHRAMDSLRRKAEERELQTKLKDMKTFLKETAGRIQKDARALNTLKRRGVDTRRAELQLRTAVQELKLGIQLMKQHKPAQAKMHFAIALDLIHRVDEFILAHA
ncbi:hypothetical protein JCM16138_14800 [Thermococcus atlanticus]